MLDGSSSSNNNRNSRGFDNRRSGSIDEGSRRSFDGRTLLTFPQVATRQIAPLTISLQFAHFRGATVYFRSYIIAVAPPLVKLLQY